jgi:TetR/AcrR family transcriptional regulator, transcriptional repressor of aconitase
MKSRGDKLPTAVAVKRPRKRLTREESREQTRASLIAVAREHFLHHGLGDAVAEKIAEDAGYSRGALYANFDGKEDLFLAVFQQEKKRRLEEFRSILTENSSTKFKLRKMRDYIADSLTDPDWIVLRAEFEAGALRSERLRKSFAEMYRSQIRDGEDLVKNLLQSSEVKSLLRPREFTVVMLNLAQGLAVTQKIHGSELLQRNTRVLIRTLFDHLISSS